MIKKMKLSKEDMKKISGGTIKEQTFMFDNDGELLILSFLEVYDNKTKAIIAILPEGYDEEAINIDKSYAHGTTPYRDVDKVREEFFKTQGIFLDKTPIFSKGY